MRRNKALKTVKHYFCCTSKEAVQLCQKEFGLYGNTPAKTIFLAAQIINGDASLIRQNHKPKIVQNIDSDAFYKSKEWRTARYLALKNSGAACQCCGAKAGDGITLHVDHIKPRYKRPDLALNLNNLQILCDDCNIGKGAWDDTDWRDHMNSITSK